MENDSYDIIICGTGVTESILSGLLSLEGYKILHIDKNQYYGDEGASVNLTTLWSKFLPGKDVPAELGHNRDWNIDLCPKFVMSGGKLVKMLLKTGVSQYMNWRPIDACYVYQYKEAGWFSKEGGRIEKVPATETEALKSDLMSLLEKRRFAKFLKFVDKTDFEKDTKYKNVDLRAVTFEGVCKKDFGLEDNTIDFIIHSVALYTNDNMLKKAALDTFKKIKVYSDSIFIHGNTPFIYPIYGLSMIPEGFARKCAVYGGTFMLDTSINKIDLNEEGKVAKVSNTVDGKSANCKILIANPSYIMESKMNEKLKSVGKVVRVICILDHPVCKDSNSSQIIIPQKQTGRKSNIYIMCVNDNFNVCKKGMYICIISTQLESDNIDKELALAYSIVGNIRHKFVTTSEMYEPVDSSFKDNIFITNSLDPTSHHESVANNVMDIYKKITGKDIDLKNLPDDE